MADVQLVAHRVEEEQTYQQILERFLDTMARTRNATFCLVPRGYTASSRRFYEALSMGCVPVLLSERFPLPFTRAVERPIDWGRIVLKHPPRGVEKLPLRLAGVSDAEIGRASCRERV